MLFRGNVARRLHNAGRSPSIYKRSCFGFSYVGPHTYLPDTVNLPVDEAFFATVTQATILFTCEISVQRCRDPGAPPDLGQFTLGTISSVTNGSATVPAAPELPLVLSGLVVLRWLRRQQKSADTQSTLSAVTSLRRMAIGRHDVGDQLRYYGGQNNSPGASEIATVVCLVGEAALGTHLGCRARLVLKR